MARSRIRPAPENGPSCPSRFRGKQSGSPSGLQRSGAAAQLADSSVSLPDPRGDTGSYRMLGRADRNSMIKIYLVSDRPDVGVIAQEIRDILKCRVHVARRPPEHSGLAEEQRRLADQDASLTLSEAKALGRADCVLAVAPGGSMELGFAIRCGIFTATIGANSSALRGLIQYHADSPREFCEALPGFL